VRATCLDYLEGRKPKMDTATVSAITYCLSLIYTPYNSSLPPYTITCLTQYAARNQCQQVATKLAGNVRAGKIKVWCHIK